jgi:type II secretory pathway predicted ATPase ExeA
MYDKFYNLKAKPFRLSPDPRFLFRSKVHSKALSYLRYGLQTGEGFVVITGGVGTGKTTLARLILSKINRSKVIAVELVTSQLESDDMLRLVAAALGLAHQDLPKSTLLRNIETFLMARGGEGKSVRAVPWRSCACCPISRLARRHCCRPFYSARMNFVRC